MKIIVYTTLAEAQAFCDFMDTKVEYQDDITARYATPVKHPMQEQYMVPVTSYAMTYITDQALVDYTDDWTPIIDFKPSN
jgi:hypothetical protein